MESWSIHYLYPPPDDLYLRFPVGRSLDKDMKIQLDSDSTMQGGVIPNIRVPLNDTVIDQLYIDSLDVELNYAIGELNSMLGFEDGHAGSTGLILEQNQPNPAISSTMISYRLLQADFVTLIVYDLCGKRIKTLVEALQKAGSYTVPWQTEQVSPGIYFYRIQTGKSAITRKCIVL